MESANGDQSQTTFVCEKCEVVLVGEKALFDHYKNNHKKNDKVMSDSVVRKLVQANIVRQALGVVLKSKPVVKNIVPTPRKRKSSDLVKSIPKGGPLPKIKMKKNNIKLPKAILNKKDTSHKGGKEFQCDCSYDLKKILLAHARKVHLNEKNYQCPKCDKSFFAKGNLTQHLTSHDKVGSFICNKSKPVKTFKSKKGLEVHYDRFHTEKKKYECHCGKVFAAQNNLIVHQRTHAEYNFTCPVCSQQFKSYGGVYMHVRSAHHDGPALYECEDCPKTDFPFTTNTPASLRQHLIMCHTSHRKFICQYCGRGFLSKVNLKNHVTGVHEDPLSHHCHLCPRSLSTKQSLQKHLERHERASNFSCFVCQVDCESEEELICHTVTDPDHKKNWGSERKSHPIEKESDYCPNLKLVLAANPGIRFKKTCGVKGDGCVICQRVIPVDAVYYQESFIPLSDSDNFDCLSDNVIYLIVCTNPACCPQEGGENCIIIMFRYCGQSQLFLKRMDEHFKENASHNPVFKAHFKTCKAWLKIVPVAKTLNFQASRNFIEIDVISALKCCDTFSGGFNFLAGGQYNVRKAADNRKDDQIQKKQQELEKRLQDGSGVDSERLSAPSSLSSDSSSSLSSSSSSDSPDSDSS